MLLEIKTTQGTLDLPDNADRDFYITKQLRDVHELDTREGDFSKTLQLPYTANNVRLIGTQTPLLTRHKDIGTQFIPVEVLMSGFPVIDSPIMRVESGDSDYFTVTLFGGMVGFFVQLSDEPIRNLDWSGANYNFKWDTSELQARRNVAIADDNVVFPNASWYTNDSIELLRSRGGTDAASSINDMQLAYAGFFMYVDTVMRRITNAMQSLNFDYGDLEKEDRYNRLAFANKMPLVREAYLQPSGGSFLGAGGAQIPQLFGQLAPFKHQIIAGTERNISLVNFEWIIPTRGQVTASIIINGRSATPPDATISIMRQSTLIRSYVYNEPNQIIRDTLEFQAEANDGIWARVETRGQAGVVMVSNFGVALNVRRQVGDDEIVVSDYLPDVSQRDFVRAVLNMFNIIPVQKQGQVTFKSWDLIPQADPLDLQLDLEREPIESGIWSGYAERNFVSYLPNELVKRQDQNAFFDIRVATTENETTKIQLPFSAIDDTLANSGNGQTVRAGVPTQAIDYITQENTITYQSGAAFTTAENHGLQIGDILIIDGLFSRVLTVPTGKSGTSQIRIITSSSANFARVRTQETQSAPLHMALMNQANGAFRILDGSTVSSEPGDFKNAVFDSLLTWSSLLDNYFKNLVNAVSNPFRLVAWFDISILDYITIDQTRPVYLPSYGALFYINRVEQFKAVGKVRMELLQVGSATNVVADEEGLQVGAFDNSFSNDFDNYDSSEI